MKKKEVSAALTILATVSALCLKGMKAIDRKMKKDRQFPKTQTEEDHYGRPQGESDCSVERLS